jgi:hypothetical protein
MTDKELIKRILKYVNSARNAEDLSRMTQPAKTKDEKKSQARAIKPAIASKILRFRDAAEKHKIRSLDELASIPGVGRSTLIDMIKGLEEHEMPASTPFALIYEGRWIKPEQVSHAKMTYSNAIAVDTGIRVIQLHGYKYDRRDKIVVDVQAKQSIDFGRDIISNYNVGSVTEYYPDKDTREFRGYHYEYYPDGWIIARVHENSRKSINALRVRLWRHE